MVYSIIEDLGSDLDGQTLAFGLGEEGLAARIADLVTVVTRKKPKTRRPQFSYAFLKIGLPTGKVRVNHGKRQQPPAEPGDLAAHLSIGGLDVMIEQTLEWGNPRLGNLQ